MPLQSGPNSMGPNMSKLLKEGYKKKQAIAIALSKAGKSRKEGSDESKKHEASKGDPKADKKEKK